MLRLLALVPALALCRTPARAQSTATLMGIDLYRSNKVTLQKIEETLMPLINDYVLLHNQRKPKSVRLAGELKTRIEGMVSGFGDFAFVQMNYMEYFTSAQHSAYLTFEVVDAEHQNTRMPFRKPPSGQAIDPEGLLESWRQYAEAGNALRNSGALSFERPPCQAFHCIWGSATPELEVFERRFAQFVPPNKKLLLDVLNGDENPNKRAAAIYLLAYLPDGDAVAAAAFQALGDPGEAPRAAGLQVISDLAVYHKEVRLDATKIIPVLDYPISSDRGRAMGILVGLIDDPANHHMVLQLGARHLLRLLRLQQPSNHDLAFTLLGVLSKQSYHRRDYSAWENWINSKNTKAQDKPRRPWQRRP